MILVVGEILFDIFPNNKRLGGAPFNFAYHLKQFGFSVRFISRIGIDDNGRKVLERVKAVGFDSNDIQSDDVHPTGTVQVRLDKDGVPEFNITPDVAYDYIQFRPETYKAYLQRAKLVYFGTLAQRTDQGFKQIHHFLRQKKPEVLSFCDINLRRGCYSDEVIKASLREADVLKLNTHELGECRRISGSHLAGSAFIRNMMAEYSLRTVALTKGEKGSELYTRQGCSRAAPAPVDVLADTVGAGDAYAAVLAAGILKKWPPERTLSTAAAFASRICTIAGAIPETDNFYEPIRSRLKNEK